MDGLVLGRNDALKIVTSKPESFKPRRVSAPPRVSIVPGLNAGAARKDQPPAPSSSLSQMPFDSHAFEVVPQEGIRNECEQRKGKRVFFVAYRFI